MKDAYAVLGVPRSASRLAIHRRYRQLAKRLHPDRNPAPDAADRFRALHDAYQTLVDPERRRNLDSALGVAPPARPPARPPRPVPRAAAKDPIEQWRDDNRTLRRTVSMLIGGIAGAMLGLRFAVVAETPLQALIALLLGVLLGVVVGFLFRDYDLFNLW